MDPNVTLQELRWGFEDLLRDLTNDDYATSPKVLEESIERLEQHFDALDGWLRRGGLLPDDWSRD